MQHAGAYPLAVPLLGGAIVKKMLTTLNLPCSPAASKGHSPKVWDPIPF
jgi:hypothetical protein